MRLNYLITISMVLISSATVAASCDPWKDWEKLPGPMQQAPLPCCPAPQQPWSCKVSVYSKGIADGCFVFGQCALSAADAVTKTDDALLPATNAAKSAPTVCVESWCDAMSQPYAIKTQGDPVCTAIEPAAGPSGGPCIAGVDACTTCINSNCCDEYAACVAAESDAICQRLVGYWLGTNPAPEGVTGSAIIDVNSCVTMNCGDVSVCTAYLKLPPQEPDAGP